MEGYIRGKPDTAWWVQQLADGIAYRKKYAKQKAWERWRRYYRGEWDADVMPKNIYFSMVRATVPRIYFRNPSVSVTPRKPGFEHMAMAQVVERTDNKLIRMMRVKEESKRIIQNAFMFGTGVGKLGFSSYYDPILEQGDNSVPITRSGARVEAIGGVVDNMPWFKSVHPGHFITENGARDKHDSRFFAHYIIRPLAQLREDPRFKNVSHLQKRGLGSHQGSLDPERSTKVHQSIDAVELYEIHDTWTGKVIVIAPHLDGEKAIMFGDDELQSDWGPMMYPVSFNPDDEVFWGVPDSQILDPYQRELNEIRTQIRKHRILSVIKIMYETGAIKEEELDKLLSSGGIAGVRVEDINKVKSEKVAGIPPELIAAEQEVMKDVRETMGFSRNEFSEFKPGSGDTTATEASIVKQASEIRLDERRDMMADMLVYMVHDMHRLVFNHWSQEQVIQIVGPMGVPFWIRFSASDLKAGLYDISIDPDTSIPETRAVREQKALKLYEVLKTNPLIDPIRLTSYLLSELKGTQFDDMLRGLPQGLGGANNPMNIGQYGQVLQKVAQQAPQLLTQMGAGNASL